MSKYEELDGLLKQFSAKELAEYIYHNDNNYALDLAEYIEQEETNEIIEHSGQTRISFTNKDEFEI